MASRHEIAFGGAPGEYQSALVPRASRLWAEVTVACPPPCFPLWRIHGPTDPVAGLGWKACLCCPDTPVLRGNPLGFGKKSAPSVEGKVVSPCADYSIGLPVWPPPIPGPNLLPAPVGSCRRSVRPFHPRPLPSPSDFRMREPRAACCRASKRIEESVCEWPRRRPYNQLAPLPSLSTSTGSGEGIPSVHSCGVNG